MTRLSTSLAISALAGCGCDGATVCTADRMTWQTPLDDFDEDDADLGCAFLSVWGPSRDDLYFAGGTLGVEPRRACGLHFDGETWTEIPLGVPQTMWWTTRTPEGTVWFVGEEGVTVRWQDGVATTFETGVDATLFGVWGASDSEVWAVGGSATGGDTDVIVRFDGTGWERVTPEEPLGALLFKVWGASADDAWIVGTSGTILHWDGSLWTTHTIVGEGDDFRPQLFTVHGRAPDDVWAVGGSATIVHFDGDAWTPYEDPTDEPFYMGQVNGVYAPEGGDVCISGEGGLKARIHSDLSHEEDTLLGTGEDLHGTWCDAEGFTFAVGGNWFASGASTRFGVIAFRGCEISTEGLP